MYLKIDTLVRALFMEMLSSTLSGENQTYGSFTTGQSFSDILLTALLRQEINPSPTSISLLAASNALQPNGYQVDKSYSANTTSPGSGVYSTPANQEISNMPQGFPSANTVTGSGKPELEEMVEQVALKYGVDQALVKSVVQTESSFNPRAVSAAGAMGLMQLMPETAASLGITDPLDPAQNIDGGVRYLKQMLNRYDGNVSLALAAYNAGPGAVDQAGGVPNYRETHSYIQKVTKNKVNYVV